MADWYVSSVLHTAVAQFAITTAYSVGNLIRSLATPSVGNERVFRCTTAGTTAGSEPSWNLGAGATTTSGTAAFTEVTGNATYAWSAPAAKLELAQARAVAGDRVWVAHNHAETGALDAGAAGGGTAVLPIPHICVNSAGSVPPVAADITTGAVVQGSSAAFNLTFGTNYAYFEGISFISALQIILGTPMTRFKNCKLTGASTNAIDLNGSTTQRVEWDNVQVDFGSTAQSIRMIGSDLIWRNTASPLPGTIPASLFTFANAARGTTLICDGVDFSAAGSGKTIFASVAGGQVRINAANCKFNASCTVTSGAPLRGSEINLFNCEGKSELRYAYGATKSKETTIIRTGGASDGVETISWKVVTDANNGRLFPFECWPICEWNSTTGSTVTATVEIVNDGTTLTNAEVWADVEYLATSSSDLAAVASSGPATELTTASNLSTSSATWTTTGLSSPVKQYVSVSFTPQKAGLVRLTLKIARASKTLYVCPKMALA